MSETLSGKTALVTGAGRGIGRAIAEMLAADGALVAVHYGYAGHAAEAAVARIIAGGGQAFAIGADLASIANIADLFARLDGELEQRTGSAGLDILINNAGAGSHGRIDQTAEEAFDMVFNINVKSLFFCLQYGIPRLRDGGRVINLSSLSSRGAMPGLAAYAATKAAVNSLTKSAAAQLGPRGITVNALAPGMVDTDLVADLKKDAAMVRAVIAQTALGRIGQPDDVAGAVAMLVSPRSGWITGQIIEVSGGARL
jgi:NAD(P)-dependent dehydrogenase (short-subunit alcohol dehydrogenase family)